MNDEIFALFQKGFKLWKVLHHLHLLAWVRMQDHLHLPTTLQHIWRLLPMLTLNWIINSGTADHMTGMCLGFITTCLLLMGV